MDDFRIAAGRGRSVCGFAGGRGAAPSTSAATTASSDRATRSFLERVGELLDDGVGEESLTHLPELRFDAFPCLPTLRKHEAKRLPDPHIFHAGESERAERVLNGLSLWVEDRMA